MPSIWRPINTLLFIGAAFILTFSASSFGGNQVDAAPRPAPDPMPSPRFTARHQKKYIWTPDIHAYPCPSGKVRGHDGDCYRIFQSHSTRSRRSPTFPVEVCPPERVRGQDGNCYHRIFSSHPSPSISNGPSAISANLLV